MATAMFNGSAMLASQNVSELNFNNAPQAPLSIPNSVSQAREALEAQPPHMKLYTIFMAICGFLYGVNLIVINPVTCCCHLGSTLKKPISPKKKALQLKNQRIQRYLEATGQLQDQENNDIEVANNMNSRTHASRVSEKSA